MKKTTLLLTIAILIAIVFTGCMRSTTDLGTVLPQSEGIEFTKYGEFDVVSDRILVGYDSPEALNELVAKIDAKVLFTIPEINTAAIRIPGDVEKTLNKLISKNIAGIRYVEPSYKREMVQPDEEETVALSAARTTNDPFYDYLWGVKKIHSEEAWALGYTGKNVVVAVCDTGCDASHPDLQGQFVDGYDPLNDKVIPAGSSVSHGNTHGTHVTGTIVAVKDNGIGVVGVAPDAKVMPVPFADMSGSFITDSYIAAGWIWAVNNGAKILQNSWGGPGYSYTQKAAVDYALEHGAVIVVSTGNTHINENWGYPNNLPGIIGVGASTVNDRVSEFSSRGDSVSVVAPGVEILSTTALTAPTSQLQDGEHYTYMPGTSMSSPHVSAVAALLYEKYPDATPYQIRKLLEMGAVGGIPAHGEATPRSAAFNEDSGYGRLDALGSVSLELPAGGTGGNVDIIVSDSSRTFAVGGMNVTLKREGKPSYRAKTDANGVCKFRAIDPDTYDLYIGGPDCFEYGSFVNRIAEERTYTQKNFVVGEDTELTIELSSQFSAEIVMPSADVEYTVKMISTFGTEYQVQTAGASETVTLTAPTNEESLQYYISVEASPTPTTGAPILTETFETGDFSNADWNWVPGGDVPATVTDTTSSEGTSCMQFGAITDEQKSELVGEFEVPDAGASYWLSFDVKTSSEEGWDFVYAYVDGTRVYTGSGETNWRTVTTQVTGGTHTIKFEYVKDGNTGVGADTGWIDNLKILPIPLDFNDYVVNGIVTLNGHTISVGQNLYLGNYVDEFELKDVPWTLF